MFEDEEKKKKKVGIVAGVSAAACLIGGATAGIIATTETDLENEESENKKTNKEGNKKSTSVPKTTSTSSQKINISSKIKDDFPLFLGKLKANNVESFIKEIQNVMNKIDELENITINDFDIYKIGTNNEKISANDIENQKFLNVKVVAKGNKFEGTINNIKVNYTKAEKKDLKEKNFLFFNYSFLQNEANNQLTKNIYNENFSQESQDKLTIKYFSDEQGQNDISNQLQKAGNIYVMITANDNHPQYKGSTNLLKIRLKNYNLDSINVNILEYKAESNLVFDDLKAKIQNLPEFNNKPITNFSLSISEENRSTVDPRNKQRIGNFKLAIISKQDDPQWAGRTKKIALKLT